MTPVHDEDLELVRRALRREVPAVAALGERLQCIGRFLRYLNGRGVPRLPAEDLDDLAGDVAATVLERLHEFSGLARLQTWVFPFCRNALRNAARRQQRQPVVVVDAHAAATAVAAQERGNETPLEPLHRCLQRLTTDEQGIVRSKHFDAVTLQEIAARSGRNVNTVKSRYFRALLRLRLCLENAGEGAP